jgi:hypothetical protein
MTAKATPGPTGRKHTHTQHDLERALHVLRLLQVVQSALRKPGTVEPGPLRLDTAALKVPVRMFVREGSPRAEKLWASIESAKSGKKPRGKRIG